MASVAFSLRSPAAPRPPSSPALLRTKGVIQCGWRSIPTAEKPQCDSKPRGISRRRALLHILIPVLSSPLIALESAAETDVQEDFRNYEDEVNKFRIMVPQGWLVGTGDSDTYRSVTAFYPEKDSSSNVSILITGLGADFTRLESFGNVDAFAETLVSGLDRSWKKPPGVAAKLINSKAKNGLYYIEYTLQNPGERLRHIVTAIGMASNGWANRLYTVTGQFMEDESERYSSQIEKSVSSFRLT